MTIRRLRYLWIFFLVLMLCPSVTPWRVQRSRFIRHADPQYQGRREAL